MCKCETASTAELHFNTICSGVGCAGPVHAGDVDHHRVRRRRRRPGPGLRVRYGRVRSTRFLRMSSGYNSETLINSGCSAAIEYGAAPRIWWILLQ